MPSTTDTDQEERQPDKAYIQPFQVFSCEQIDVDSCVSYPKLDSLASYLDKDFNQELEWYLDKQTLLSLLMVGFNGKKRTTETTSNPAENKLAEDVKRLVTTNPRGENQCGDHWGECGRRSTI